MSKLLLPGLIAAVLLCACVARPPAGPAATAERLPRYRCEQGIEFTLRYGDGSALVDAGPRGRELLLRDAGGLTPQQTVYSNPRLRAEFGLGAGGDEAILHYAAPPLQAHCRRDAGPS